MTRQKNSDSYVKKEPLYVLSSNLLALLRIHEDYFFILLPRMNEVGGVHWSAGNSITETDAQTRIEPASSTQVNTNRNVLIKTCSSKTKRSDFLLLPFAF